MLDIIDANEEPQMITTQSDHPKLTARQQQILELIQSSIAETGAPPTRAEIARTLGFKSANAAEEHLQALARKGVIDLVSGTSRGIRLKGASRMRSDADSGSGLLASLTQSASLKCQISR